MIYTLLLLDGTSAVGYYSWLTVDLLTPALTINTADEANAGIYDFQLCGVYGTSSYSACGTFQIHVVKTEDTVFVPRLVYKVGEYDASIAEQEPFKLLYAGNNHKIRSYSFAQIDLSTNTVSTTALPSAIVT